MDHWKVKAADRLEAAMERGEVNPWWEEMAQERVKDCREAMEGEDQSDHVQGVCKGTGPTRADAKETVFGRVAGELEREAERACAGNPTVEGFPHGINQAVREIKLSARIRIQAS